MDCEEEYTGESGRTFGEMFKEHLRTTSPIYDHCNITGHTTPVENFSIVEREQHNLARSMKIRLNYLSLKRNIGQYHPLHMQDEVLLNMPELKFK